MERRRANRKLTQTRVVVHHKSFESTPLTTKNMSQSGVFVETHKHLDVQPGTRIELTFMVDLGSLIQLRKVSATVVQATHEGLRLSFTR